jgi:hypothetical protein
MLTDFAKWIVRNTFASKREKVVGFWRKLHSKELHDLYYSPNIIQIKPRRIRLTN